MFHDGWMWGWHWIWWAVWIVILIAVVVFVVRGMDGRRRAIDGARDAGAERESALDLLERRYAAGEISTEEFEERRDRLTR